MYAAAGGASLASARKRQKQNKIKNPPKVTKPVIVPPVKVEKPVPQSKPFHQLPNNYHRDSTLRLPSHGHERKLSGQFSHSKTLLTIEEQSASETPRKCKNLKISTPVHKSSSVNVNLDRNSHQKPEGGGSKHDNNKKGINKSAFDLNRTDFIPNIDDFDSSTDINQSDRHETGKKKPELFIPIIDVNQLDGNQGEQIIGEDGMPIPPRRVDSISKPLERQCSVNRNLQLEQDFNDRFDVNNVDKQLNLSCYNLSNCPQMVPNGYDFNSCLPHDPQLPPSCSCGLTECAQGKAAWLDRGRRCSVTEAAQCHRTKQSEAHRRWMKRNRIHDSSFGGSSSDDEDFLGLYHQSNAANAVLYVGLGTVAIGLVISFVGTGEKGFKTLELRLIGPTLIGCGLLCCLVRILLCVCPSSCLTRRRKKRLSKKSNRHFEDNLSINENKCSYPNDTPGGCTGCEDYLLIEHTSLLTKNNKKRVSIAQPHESSARSKHEGGPEMGGETACRYESKGAYELRACFPRNGVETGTRDEDNNTVKIATTSLFLQNEQTKSMIAKPIPTINIPDLLTLDEVTPHCSYETDPGSGQRMVVDTSIDILSIGSVDNSESSGEEENDSITVLDSKRRNSQKLSKNRAPLLRNSSDNQGTLGESETIDDITLLDSSLMLINPSITPTPSLNTPMTSAPNTTKSAYSGKAGNLKQDKSKELVLTPAKLGQ